MDGFLYYAEGDSAPDSFLCILDMDEGYMAFSSDRQYYGVAFTGLKGKTLYPIVSSVWGHCEITMEYLGGLDRTSFFGFYLFYCRYQGIYYKSMRSVEMSEIITILLSHFILYNDKK